MGWFWNWSKPEPLTEKETAKLQRKCNAFISSLEACRKANKDDPKRACKNLEIRVVSCYAEEHCVKEAEEHQRCYTKLYTSGMYNGLGHCIPYEEAMKKALKRRGLNPV